MRDPTRSPFPGMDPYLEQVWPDVHHRLCTYSCDALRGDLPSGLIPRLDERTLIEWDEGLTRSVVPDIGVLEKWPGPTAGGTATLAPPSQPIIVPLKLEHRTEGFVRIIDTKSGGRLVTVIEFTSPANKLGRSDRGAYQQKQEDLVEAGVNVVEVDLLRAGEWNTLVRRSQVPQARLGGYHVCVVRHVAGQPRGEVYLFGVRDPLPRIAIPLRHTDADVFLDLPSLIAQVYLNGSHGYDTDYSKPPVPELTAEDAGWARELLAATA